MGRYDDQPRIHRMRADGTAEVLLARRIIPPAAGTLPGGTVRVQPAERLDMIAAAALGDPLEWWRIADANPVLDPAELEQPGRALRLSTGMALPGEVP